MGTCIGNRPAALWNMGEVPYTMYVGKQRIRMEQAAFPEKLAAGTDFALQLKLTPEEKLRRPIPVWLRVVREGQLFLEQRLDDGKRLADCDTGKTLILKAMLSHQRILAGRGIRVFPFSSIYGIDRSTRLPQNTYRKSAKTRANMLGNTAGQRKHADLDGQRRSNMECLLHRPVCCRLPDAAHNDPCFS